MKAFGLMMLAVVVCSGCVNRMPLKSLPEANRGVLRVESKLNGNVRATTESAFGRNSRLNSGSGGLVGMTVVELVASPTEAGSQAVLQELLRKTGYQEAAVLDQAVKAQLSKAGLSWSEQQGNRTLTLQLDAVGLEEFQHGFWRVSVGVTATVRNPAQQNIWTVHVNASSPTQRTLEDFSRQPQLYAGDFREAAEDATRQLIVGPIRK